MYDDRGGLRSYLQVKLILKYSNLQSERFLRNQDISLCRENIDIQSYGPLDFI